MKMENDELRAGARGRSRRRASGRGQKGNAGVLVVIN